jgi:hypothetical protein
MDWGLKKLKLEVYDLYIHVHPSLAREKGFVEATAECKADLMRAQPQHPPNYELVGGGED